MTSSYQPFPITEFKTGLYNYLQPWIRPADAFDPLENAYIYRGCITKRNGTSIFGDRLDDHNPVMGLMQYINETTGTISLLAATTVHLYLYNVGGNTFGTPISGATFTGNITNFFNWTNWQASSGADSILYMVNNKDNLTEYNGTVATQVAPAITNAGSPPTITTALDVKVYKNRLLLIRPQLSTASGPENQAIYWSALNNPTDFVTNIAGHGGFLEAPTGDTIQSAEFLRDVLIVFFTNSTWIFRYTGNETNPFRFDKLNNSKSSNAPYASIQYDERVTSIGSTGFIACDGVNVQRYDVSIIDYYQTNFSEQYYAQAFSQRYDNLNQSWTLYVSTNTNTTDFPLVGSIAPGSDQAIIYNFVENSWATYTFQTPMTCLGLFYAQSGRTWASFNHDPEDLWKNKQATWNSYFNQSRAPILLSGDTVGNVYLMDDGNQDTDNGQQIIPDIISTRWNPIIPAGQKVQFGYVDIYYQIVSRDASTPLQVTINFYANNSESESASRVFTFDGPVSDDYAWKRVFINLMGEFVRMEIAPISDESIDTGNHYFKIAGMVLWARPAGRLTP